MQMQIKANFSPIQSLLCESVMSSTANSGFACKMQNAKCKMKNENG
jgi:hypothetical protein